MFLGRKFLIILMLIMLMVAVGVHAGEEVSQSDLSQSVYGISVYFAPDDDNLLTDDVEKELGIVRIHEKELLHRFINEHPDPLAVYIHEAKFNEVEPAIFQSLYEQGNVIVALGAPISYLDMVIELPPHMPEHGLTDLNRAVHIDDFGEQTIVASAYFSLGAGNEESEGYYVFSDFFDEIKSVHTIVTQMFLVNSTIAEKEDMPSPLATAGVWTDSTGGQLFGHSWTSKSGSFFYGNVYSDYLTDTPYFQVAQVKTYNNCGYWHQISSAYKKDTYASGATQITGIMMGSTQCGTYFETQGMHESQRNPSSSTYVSGTTSASCTGYSNC